MKFGKLLFMIGVFAPCGLLWAQDADLPIGHEAYHYIDRLDIQGLTGNTIHTDQKQYGRGQVSQIFADTDTSAMSQRDRDWFRLTRVAADDDYADANPGKGVLKYLFRNRRDAFSIHTDQFRLYANVVGHINAGIDRNDFTVDGSTQQLLNYRNSRGVQLRGSISNRLGFFTELTENQVKHPQFVRNSYNELGVLYGQNFVKQFDAAPNTGFDYFGAKGYITYSPGKQFRLKLGKDRAFWGNGYQSLILNDQATDYFFLNMTTRIWKLEYINHFTMMTDWIPNKPDGYGTFPKKYAAFHEINYKPWKQLSVGVFESVVYSPNLPGGHRGFELEYLNPIIFYRSVEQSLGSPDNSMLGLHWKVNALKRFQHYGQFLLDDLNFRNRANGSGFVGNKYGFQFGLKYINAFWVPRLDLQVEYNWMRPYTYSHFNPSASFSHYGQPLGYAFGANAYDLTLIARYQPFPRWSLLGTISMITKGKDFDPTGLNYGGNLNRPYSTYFQDYNNFVGQGNLWKCTQVYGRISYRVLNLDGYVDLEGRFRKENANTSMSVLGSLRVNLPNQIMKF
ncbi:MAG: hypothetical protein U0176_25010 [Bacteroidia bacterium]